MKRKCQQFKQTKAGKRCASYSDIKMDWDLAPHEQREYLDTSDPVSAIEESILDSLQAAEVLRKKHPRSKNLNWAVEDLHAAHTHWKQQNHFGALAYLKHAARLTAMAR